MKFDIKTWALIILAGAFILYILFDKDPIPNESYVAEYESTIQRNESTIKALESKHVEDSLRFTHKIAELRDSLKTSGKHTVKIERSLAKIKANPVIIKVRDSIKVVDDAFITYDSTLAAKNEEIRIQGKMIVSLEDENQRITSNFLERLSLQSENLATQKEIIDDQRKELRKERRKVKLFKVVAVVGTVGAFILGAGL